MFTGILAALAAVLAILLASPKGLALVAVGLGFEFVNGSHDAGNAISTLVHSRTMKRWPATIMASFFNLLGALTVGTAVAAVIIKIIPVEAVSTQLLAAVLIGGSLWNVLTLSLGIPASSSHCLIGALIGASIAANGVGVVVHNPAVVQAWSGSDSVFHAVVNTAVAVYNAEPVFHSEEVLKAGKGLFFWPFLGAAFAFVMILVIRLFSWIGNAILPASIIEVIAHPFGDRKLEASNDTFFGRAFNRFAHWCAPEQTAGKLSLSARLTMIVAACSLSYSHGGNDGQKMMGIITLIAALYFPQFGVQSGHIPLTIMLLCASAIALGTCIGGGKIIETQGKMSSKPISMRIGNAAQLVTALTIWKGTLVGFPVSTTHVLTSALAGAQLGEHAQHVNYRLLGRIFLAWVFTIPVCMFLSGGIYLLLKAYL